MNRPMSRQFDQQLTQHLRASRTYVPELCTEFSTAQQTAQRSNQTTTGVLGTSCFREAWWAAPEASSPMQLLPTSPQSTSERLSQTPRHAEQGPCHQPPASLDADVAYFPLMVSRLKILGHLGVVGGCSFLKVGMRRPGERRCPSNAGAWAVALLGR